MRPSLDFETYSAAGFVWREDGAKWVGPPGAPKGQKGLPVVGVASYVQHPSTEVLCLVYTVGGPLTLWLPGYAPPVDLFAHVAAGGLLEGWNVAFEWWVWNEVCIKRYGWPPLPLEQTRCAMAKSRAHGLPGKLADVSDVLDLPRKKDPEGVRLLAKFSMPRKPTKGDPRVRIDPATDPTDGPRLYGYCGRDVEAEHDASDRTPDLSPLELRNWLHDQRINRRGVQVDVASVHACCAIVEQAVERYEAELVALCGIKPTEIAQLTGWLHGMGVHTDSLDEDATTALLAGALPPIARRAIEIRQAVGSASVKKVFAIRNQMTAAGRLHDLYNFHGARTGRPTGEGPQPTNLPKAGPQVYRCATCSMHYGPHRVACPWCGALRPPGKPREWSPEAAEHALEVIGWRSLALLEAFFGNALQTVAGCLRGLFVAAPGHKLVSSDFTAIEGVVIACLAGEQWRIDAYRNDAPMYLLSAERMYGVPVAEMLAYAKEHGHHHPRRQDGKFGELGLGFGGWIGALRGLGAEGTDEELKAMVLAWRDASPALVEFWGGQMRRRPWPEPWVHERFGLEGMAIEAIENPGREYPVHRLDGGHTGISYVVRDDVLYCFTPGGGRITYHRPRLARSDQEWRGLSISYEGHNTNPKAGPMGWVTMYLYGGKLAENVTQKVARDIQMHAIHNCETNGYPLVLHTYDEEVAEVRDGSVAGLEALMVDVPEFARGWPIKAAGGWEGWRYRKA